MRQKPLRSEYLPGSVIQYRDGRYKIKTTENGLVPLSRFIASNSSKVVNGGEDLQKGWRVHHLDMSTYGTDEHDRPENLVVLKCRTVEFKFLKTARMVKEPKSASRSIRELVLK